MTPTTQTTTDPLALPAALDRTKTVTPPPAPAQTEAPAPAQTEAPAPAQTEAPAPAQTEAKATGIAQTVEKQAKVKAPRKGKVVDAAHKPSEVKATDQNPQKSIVPVRFKTRYAETGDSCGDRVALALKTYTTGTNADGRPCCDVAKLKEVASANGLDWSAYSKMNVGQQRMNIGNRLRGMLKNEKPVTIGKQRFADWEKAKLVDTKAWAKPEPKAKAQAAA